MILKIFVTMFRYCLNCTIFDELILSKIIKTVATRCHIFSLKYTKFDFGWGSGPDHARGAYNTPPDPLVEFKGPTSKGREGGDNHRAILACTRCIMQRPLLRHWKHYIRTTTSSSFA